MLRSARARRSPLDVRRCLACGYGGRLAQLDEHDDSGSLRGDREVRTAACRCPHCGCDFRARPPRSYAEMEGLDRLPARSSRHATSTSESRAIERWIVFLFGAVLLCVVAGSLLAAAIAPFIGSDG